MMHEVQARFSVQPVPVHRSPPGAGEVAAACFVLWADLSRLMLMIMTAAYAYYA